MNGVSSVRGNLPATMVLRMGPGRPARAPYGTQGGDTVLAGVEHPPRKQETSPLSALMPEVLARYGIEPRTEAHERFEAVA